MGEGEERQETNKSVKTGGLEGNGAQYAFSGAGMPAPYANPECIVRM
jgi:hypothetical protein